MPNAVRSTKMDELGVFRPRREEINVPARPSGHRCEEKGQIIARRLAVIRSPECWREGKKQRRRSDKSAARRDTQKSGKTFWAQRCGPWLAAAPPPASCSLFLELVQVGRMPSAISSLDYSRRTRASQVSKNGFSLPSAAQMGEYKSRSACLRDFDRRLKPAAATGPS